MLVVTTIVIVLQWIYFLLERAASPLPRLYTLYIYYISILLQEKCSVT